MCRVLFSASVIYDYVRDAGGEGRGCNTQYDQDRYVKGKGPAQVIQQVSQYGIKVSFWGSETLKIVIPVENHPQKPKICWMIITPSVGGGCQ